MSILTKKYSDYNITLFFLILGCIFWVPIFYFAIQESIQLNKSLSELIIGFLQIPALAIPFFMWLKALIIDYSRIKKGESGGMPGFVFWFLGLETLIVFSVFDMFSSTDDIMLYFSATWILVDLITPHLIKNPTIRDSSYHKKYKTTPTQEKLFWNEIVNRIVFTIFVFADMVIGLI